MVCSLISPKSVHPRKRENFALLENFPLGGVQCNSLDSDTPIPGGIVAFISDPAKKFR